VRAKFFQDLPLPASTLIGVQALAAEEYLFEIEATAVVD
jgi:enamine deaminase RidA (YjgF/YER057c/UK114 family)